ncbi:glycine cleavage system aminomethyltransferase GcvT [Corynebacterium felinum]|uniref:Aminomethyltransferase n=1 Tax=Corynebacterium felinum TaxID=131318 RepID=A0ABU2BC56_9CORY|nr:glycine cleavage system aminomethyltransferase GcvT [Corynebacterium felinum]MDF5820348.1 glycine cleavage system aminomethyltransferase GcvT [Corynebacterium felinum]MDR7356200.1 aminomethyltransferase [Corynebacterium felinum]WJY95532.1 Aminomethyltransferase [Corynebacterium felinum]
MTELRLSPLHAEHEKLGASFTPFGPWNMPLKYANELDEHRAVRNTCGLFDLSHMGEVRVSGRDAAAFLDYALISHISAVKEGKAKYTMIVTPEGGIIDDLIVYRLGAEEFLVVPNAGNAEIVFEQLVSRSEGFDVTVVNESQDTALIAVQGPNAEALLLTLTDSAETVTQLGYYAAVPATIAGHEVLLARTGYTGEDGFELFIPNAQAVDLWQKLLVAGEGFELKPAGLAARDSLRLEAGMPLYGNELSLSLTPIDAGLGVLVGKKKEADFVAKQVLLSAAPAGRVLVGLTSSQRRAARAHSQLFIGDELVGEVTSGQPSPTLGHPIALAYVDVAHAAEGTALEADVRGKRYPFEVVTLPFYSRKK